MAKTITTTLTKIEYKPKIDATIINLADFDGDIYVRSKKLERQLCLYFRHKNISFTIAKDKANQFELVSFNDKNKGVLYYNSICNA